MAYTTKLVSVTKTAVAGNGYSGLDGTVTGPASSDPSVEFGESGRPSDENAAISQSANGRFIVFTSAANNFVSGDNNDARDIFLKDMTSGVLTKISSNSFTTNSSNPDVSNDGKYVSFETGGDVYRVDVQTSAQSLVASDASNSQMSANGQFIVYTSDHQIYLRDMLSGGAPILISEDSLDNAGETVGGHGSDNAFVSNDGNFVVFHSSSNNFVDVDSNSLNANASFEVYMKNIQTGALTRISESAEGDGGVTTQSGPIPASADAMISGNGRYVVFESSNNDFIDINGIMSSAIYRKDLVTGNIDLVSTQTKTGIRNQAEDASVSDDGRFVVFKSRDSIGLQSFSQTDNNFIYVKDMANGDVYAIDIPRAKLVTTAGPISFTSYLRPYESFDATISGDGKYVTLSSTQNLVAGTIPKTTGSALGNNDGQFDVFRIDISKITSKAAIGQILPGTTAADTLIGGMGPDTLTGGLGNDTLDGDTGIDKLLGGAGDDTYKVDLKTTGSGTKAVASMQDIVTEGANAGDDTIELRGSTILTKASTIALIVNVENLDASATGTTLLNLTGNALNNEIIGNDAANKIGGVAGNDTLDGGSGNDTLDGGAGVDSLIGGDGDDIFTVDIIKMGTGALATVVLQDTINESSNEGNDTITLRGSVTTLTTATTLVLDGLLSEVENINASATTTTKLNLTGNALNNILIGNAAANILMGNEGNDSLVGGAGNDSLLGGAGNDTLIGGLGKDVLTGDGGDDIFDFNVIAESAVGVNHDVITDFTNGDRIDLSTIDASTKLAGNQTFTLIEDDAFSHVAGQLRYEVDGGNTHVYGDTDGNGTADFQIELTGVVALQATDFIL